MSLHSIRMHTKNEVIFINMAIYIFWHHTYHRNIIQGKGMSVVGISRHTRTYKKGKTKNMKRWRKKVKRSPNLILLLFYVFFFILSLMFMCTTCIYVRWMFTLPVFKRFSNTEHFDTRERCIHRRAGATLQRCHWHFYMACRLFFECCWETHDDWGLFYYYIKIIVI